MQQSESTTDYGARCFAAGQKSRQDEIMQIINRVETAAHDVYKINYNRRIFLTPHRLNRYLMDEFSSACRHIRSAIKRG